ncbi:unnamed protein product, partial [marine sediment metagenome]
GLGPEIFSAHRAVDIGLPSVALFLGAYLAGTALVPAFLPWLPGRAFASKGAWAGLVVVLAAAGYTWLHPGLYENWLSAAAWVLIIPAVASFIGMNFTGASTYTSLSGVRREMRIAVPLQIAGAAAGLGLWLPARFV